jgi:hypothetical protein
MVMDILGCIGVPAAAVMRLETNRDLILGCRYAAIHRIRSGRAGRR